MRVKRYVVESMPDALQKIRSELGKDAVILNTKEIKTGGFLGLFTKKKIEVIAATDNTAQNPPTPAAAAASAKRDAVVSSAQASFMKKAYSPAAAYTSKTNSNISPLLLDETEYVKEPVIRNDEPIRPPVNAPAAPQPAAAPLPVFPPAQELPSSPARLQREDALMEEIKWMKDMMLKLSQQQKGGAVRLPEALTAVEQKLLAQEIEPLFVHSMIDRIQEEAAEAGLEEPTLPFAEESARRQLTEMLSKGANKHLAPDTQIAHFVGPTGVGKTTTIAKLAAEQVLKYHRKVGFITSDTYRIAAVEQLKTYGTILNVPLEVVFSPQDLPKAFEKLADRDIIFMDTAGRNFRNEMYVSELNSLLQNKGKSETFLVLSLTTKYKDMQAITNNFTKFKLDKVLFTKMDETESYGAIVNLLQEFGLQLSYVTNGQSVPDDIIEADEHKIIDLIMGERP